ncbi:GFA family protein [Erythrobacter sp. NFXS35]|uniref:GFA family protein n=1 Tax=Erythrobacter sp. NFXS35 TaxID=2818436 RepID=UPI0032DF2954
MTLDCFCGGVRVTTVKKPEFLHACNCDLCRKSGARWGYFDPSEAAIDGQTSSYRRHDKPEPAVDVHFCPKCGSTTHFRLTERAASTFGDTMMGVNMALSDQADLVGVELRYPDGMAWSGEGAFGYTRESRILGPDG